MRYVLANIRHVGRYEEMGYDVVPRSDDANAPRLSNKPRKWRGGDNGDHYTDCHESHGHILMQIPQKDYDLILQEGEDGLRGRKLLDERDAQMINPMGDDSMRGLHGSRYYKVKNETTRARPVAEVGI